MTHVTIAQLTHDPQ